MEKIPQIGKDPVLLDIIFLLFLSEMTYIMKEKLYDIETV